MPTYDYECQNGHRFEVFQKMSDEPVSSCPECEAAATRVISGGAGFLFKGDGFYITESRSDEYRKKASAEKGDSVGSSPSDSGSSGSAPAKSEKSENTGSSGGSASSGSES